MSTALLNSRTLFALSKQGIGLKFHSGTAKIAWITAITVRSVLNAHSWKLLAILSGTKQAQRGVLNFGNHTGRKFVDLY